MSELKDLERRLAAMGSPCRLVDADIQLLLMQEPNEHYNRPWRQPILLPDEHRRPGLLEYVEISGVSARVAPRFTSSIDDAMAFFERTLPGRGLLLGRGKTRSNEPIWGVQIHATDFLRSGSPHVIAEGEAEAAALALCLATVRALAAVALPLAAGSAT